MLPEWLIPDIRSDNIGVTATFNDKVIIGYSFYNWALPIFVTLDKHDECEHFDYITIQFLCFAICLVFNSCECEQ